MITASPYVQREARAGRARAVVEGTASGGGGWHPSITAQASLDNVGV